MKKALQVIATKYNADVWNMAGPGQKADRVFVMRELTGEKTPASKCGVNAIMDLLFKAANPAGCRCYAERNDKLVEWIRENA